LASPSTATGIRDAHYVTNRRPARRRPNYEAGIKRGTVLGEQWVVLRERHFSNTHIQSEMPGDASDLVKNLVTEFFWCVMFPLPQRIGLSLRYTLIHAMPWIEKR
jgi:hypothetical protein